MSRRTRLRPALVPAARARLQRTKALLATTVPIASTVPVAITVAAAIGGCGGASRPARTLTRTRSHASALPAEASSDVRFASDSGLPGSVPSSAEAGKLIAWSGFEPGINGFSFQNYGFIAGADLDQASMRQLFGNAVCATAPSNSCTLTPAAQQWESATEQIMVGGHCFGFSTMALRFFTHYMNPNAYGGSTTYSLAFTPALQAEIGEAWATIVSPAVYDAYMPMTPSAIVSFLTNVLRHRGGPAYTLVLYSGPAGDSTRAGHAITPIGISRLGGGRYQILVYDNNKPDTVQAMSLNTRAETWSYLLGTNPSQPASVWSGHGTENELLLIPLSVSDKVEPCPFCYDSGTTGTDTVTLSGDPVAHAQLLITTASGRKLGYVGNRFVNQIRGAHVINPEANEIWKAAPEPVYEIPAGQKLTVTVHGGDPTGTDTAELHITGPGFGTTVENLVPSAASETELTLTPGARSVSVRLLGHLPAQTPTLQLARDRGRGGKLVTLTPTHATPAGTALSVGLPTLENRVSATSSTSQPVRLTLKSVGPSGTKTVSSKLGLSSRRPTNLTLGLIRIG